MMHHRIFPLVLVCASIFSCVDAQTPTPAQGSLKERAIPDAGQPRERDIRPLPPLAGHAPFSLEGDSSSAVEVLPEASISEQDKLLEANAESTIREHATLQALDLTNGANGQWSYSELACKSFPRHLFLRFNRNNGAGDESAFTVSIPRDGNGRIRFIPLLRRGYSLWSPTPVNAITIASFNHILAEENPEVGPDDKPFWVNMAVCYAALAGSDGPNAQEIALTRLPIAHVSSKGPNSVLFVTGDKRPHLWEMVFDRNGVLKKATHIPINREEERSIPVAKNGN